MASVATATLSTQAINYPSFNLLDDRRIGLGSFDDSDQDSSTATTPDRNPAGVAQIRALQETCVNFAQNENSGPGRLLFPQNPESSNNTSLTWKLEQLRISALAAEATRSELEGDDLTPQHPHLSKKLPARPTIGTETFQPPEHKAQLPPPSLGGTVLEVSGGDVATHACESLERIVEGAPLDGRKSKEISAIFADHPLMRLPSNFANIEEQVAKTQAGQYELHITYPAAIQSDPNPGPDENRHPSLAGETKIGYGGNYVRRNTVSKAALRKGCHIADTVVLIASPMCDEVVPQKEPKALVDQMKPVAVPSPAAIKGLAKSPTSSSAPKLVQIEDSVEALDKLEEELEAVNAVTHFGRVPSPELKQTVRSPKSTRQPSSPLYPATVRVKASEPVRAAARRSRSMSVDTEDGKGSVSTNTESLAGQSDSPARKPFLKPASLAPPKPLAKSSKPSTVATFELPGEAVARRLKEQRAARRSAQIEADKRLQAPRPPLLQRTGSRALPRPTFELPGEAISRRKREERDARIRAEEEEMRRRREFKARPIKGSLGQPSTLPRETATSRVRQSMAEEISANMAKTKAGKRLSLAPTFSGLGGSPQSRGRNAARSSEASRTTSLSATSSVSKRSTLSSDDMTQQKLRGKTIYERDSSLVAERDRERLEREVCAKTAREEAAERSRQASREWAEKQERRRVRASMAGARGSG